MEGVVIIADSKGDGYDFARGVYEYVRGVKNRSFPVSLSDIEKTHFRDGEYKLKISENIRRKICFFIHDSNKNPPVWVSDLVFTLDAMTSSSPSEINVVFPYMRFTRQDRKDESRTSVNIKAIADLVSIHANRGMTIDLHTPQIQEYFAIPFDNLVSHPVLIEYIRERKIFNSLENLVVVSPDAGGGKRVESFQKALGKNGVDAEMAVCYKRRIDDGRIEEIRVMGEVKDKNCFILDDLIDSGGTLVGTYNELKERGAERVVAYGTHGLFTKGFEELKLLDKVLVGNTLSNIKNGNVEVVSLIELFGEAIYRTSVGESLSSLFE